MKITVLALCCVLFASQAFGQQAPQTQGRSKAIWTGVGLLAAGLIVMPMRHSPRRDVSTQRRNPNRPQLVATATTVGLGWTYTLGWAARDLRLLRA
jgi:hypothetical protein